MATAQQVIELVFNGVDKTGAATQSALNNLSSFSNSATAITQPVADFTVAALKLEAGILAAGAAMVAFSIKSAGDFDVAFKQISTLFDASESDLADFKNAILDYSSTSSKSLEDITNSISAAVGSGVKWSDSIALIATAEKLATATRAELKGTTEVLVSTMNAYGIQTADAGKVSDLFFKIIADGKIEMDDLSQYLANITPISSAAGVSLEEVGGAIATLTAAGMQPSTAIDALKSAISNIIKPSQQATTTAAELGIEFNASALKSKGLAGVLDDVAKATGGSTEKMALLFGDVTGLASVLSLTGPLADKFKDSVAGMGDSAGAVAAAFAKMTGSVEQSTAKVTNSLNALFVRIGTPLLDEFGGIATAIAAVFNALGSSVERGSFGDLVDYVESIMGDIQATVEQVARNLPEALEGADFSGFKNGLDVVIKAVKDLFGGIDLSTVEGLKAAIATTGAAFLGLSSYVAGVVASFKPLFDTLVSVGSGLSGVNAGFFKTAGEMAGFVTQANLLAGGLNSLLPALDALVSLLVLKQAGSLVGGLAGAAAGAGALGTALGSAGLVAAAGAAGYGVGTLLVEPINKLTSTLTGSQTTLGGWIYDLVKGGDEATDFGAKTAKAATGVDTLGQSVEDAGKAVEESKNPFEAANDAMLATYAASEKAAGGAAKLAEATGTAGRGIAGVTPIFDAATGKIVGYEQAATKGGASIKKVAEETEKAKDATQKWMEEVAKMNFQEKLKLIEQQTAIMTAQIEADAQKTVAAFESIAASIESTGDVLGELFGALGKPLDSSALNKIYDQIDKENDFRQKAFDLQKKMTEAQIEKTKAQTNAINKGDALIKVDGAGLQPHLEAFMWEILQTIQVRVNADGLDMLLGKA